MGILNKLFGSTEPVEQKALDLAGAMESFGLIPAGSGPIISGASALRVPAVRRASVLIAEAVGTIPFKFYEADTRDTASDHPAYALVHDWSSDWQSAEAFREQVTLDCLIAGQGFGWVRRNSEGKPVFLARIDPSNVTIRENVLGEPRYFVRLQGQDEIVLEPQDVLHISCPGGISPISHAREAIGLCAAAESHLSGFFKNGGRPSGVIKHPGKLEVDGAQKLAASWFKTHSGEQAGSTAVLDEGMDYQEIAMKLVDAEFSEIRREQIREIARAFGIAPAILFETSRATWSNFEQSHRDFLTNTLRPWLARWAAAYTRCLLPVEDRGAFVIEAVADDMLAVDHVGRANAFSQYRSMGVLTANEVRATMNRPPLPGGDELQNPFTTTSAPPAQVEDDEQPQPKENDDE